MYIFFKFKKTKCVMKTIFSVSKNKIEYVKGVPYFCKHNKIKAYPYLNKNIKADVLIVGGGIVGAIANYYLSKNFDVVCVDKSRFGMCLTSCATVLLEYQLDDYAQELKKYLTEQQIIKVYNLGLKAIEKIEKFILMHRNNCYFCKRPSLLFTNKLFGSHPLKAEFDFRIKHGFSANFLTDCTTFPFKFKAGLYCKNGGAEFNPYLFCKQLIENSCNQNNLYENTEITNIKKCDGGYIAQTEYGEKIYCNKIIFSTGYNFELTKKPEIIKQNVSYSIVTNPLPNLNIPHKTLIQDDASPYHYLRTIDDGRIIFGGEDNALKCKGIKEKTAQKKYKKLYRKLLKMFPSFKNKIKVEHKFCGAFASTKNNLGLIGKGKYPHIYHFVSCGANGIINAMIGVEILEDLLNNKSNPFAILFDPNRKN